MFTIFKQWKVRRDLLTLAQRDDFIAVDPLLVTSILERFADSKLGSSIKVKSVAGSGEKKALMSIWEHARICSKRNDRNQAGWQRVMASCNALYEQFGHHRSTATHTISL